jgi:DNA-directed RNA polymerase subunit RPC12/RpoP
MKCPICGQKMSRLNDINEYHHNKLECPKCNYRVFYREHHKMVKDLLF